MSNKPDPNIAVPAMKGYGLDPEASNDVYDFLEAFEHVKADPKLSRRPEHTQYREAARMAAGRKKQIFTYLDVTDRQGNKNLSGYDLLSIGSAEPEKKLGEPHNPNKRGIDHLVEHFEGSVTAEAKPGTSNPPQSDNRGLEHLEEYYAE